jgi:hypothetical protein
MRWSNSKKYGQPQMKLMKEIVNYALARKLLIYSSKLRDLGLAPPLKL